jgi:hypothetical protein
LTKELDMALHYLAEGSESIERIDMTNAAIARQLLSLRLLASARVFHMVIVPLRRLLKQEPLHGGVCAI